MSNTIMLIAGIVVLFLLIRFVTKIIVKIVGAVFVLGFLVYVLFYWNGGMLDLGNKDFMLKELQQKYCHVPEGKIKCDCIIEPLMDDIYARHSAQEIEKLQNSKAKSLLEISRSMARQRKEIMQCLHEKNATNQWDEFLKELKDMGENLPQNALDSLQSQ